MLRQLHRHGERRSGMYVFYIFLRFMTNPEVDEKFGSHGTWNFNSTKDDIRRQYQLVHNLTELLITLAPDSGAYFVREVIITLMCLTDKVC